MHNALQFPVFFPSLFFYQPYLECQGIWSKRCLLSKPHPPTFTPVLNSQYQVGWNTKLNKACLFYIVFQVLKVLIKSFKMRLPVLFILSCLASTFTSGDIIFTTFQNLIQNYLKKLFVTNFPFVVDSPKALPHPLNDQNLQA